MSQLSDDESSDSSNEFLVPADKIDLNSSFFTQSTKKGNLEKAPVVQESLDDSDDEFDYTNESNVSSAELLCQVLKNLENSKNHIFLPATNQASTSKATEQVSTEFKQNDLSKEISDLLIQGESAATLAKEDNYDNEEEDSKAEAKPYVPEKGVEIHLPGENLMFDRRKKKQQDLQKLLQSKINQRIRSTQVFIHKVGLLSWLCHGFFLNKLVNDPELLATALSLVSSNNYPKGRVDLKYIERFTKWFAGMFKICEENEPVIYNRESLMSRISDKNIYNYVELVLLYIATVRGMGINCRLVISLQPPPLKPKPEHLFKIPTNETNESTKLTKEENITEKTKKTKAIISSKTAQAKRKTDKTKSIQSESEKQSTSSTKVIPENSQEAAKTANLEARKKAASILKGKLSAASLKGKAVNSKSNQATENTKKIKKVTIDDESVNDIVDESTMTIARKLRLRSDKKIETDKTVASTSKTNEKKISKSKLSKQTTKRKHSPSSSSNDEFSGEKSDFSTDEDYAEKKTKKKAPKKTNENRTIASKLANQTKNPRKLLSSDEDDKTSVKNVYNIWVEVYIESEESWISVSVLDKKIHCVSEIYKKADHPVLYIVAWNSAGTLKDVTRRYCPHWLTDTRKKRVDEKWWHDTLSTWNEKKTAMSKAEDEQLLQRELEQPLPKTVSECKGHPLYVLVRHLLKYEALYPPDVVPLGLLKNGEAIYSRHCVHTLYSRESWVKKARVVKPAQEAYKIVKSMPKYDKLSGMKIKDQPLELFGRWQTTPYVPPEAKDGKVPRNEYGNVDLFKMCMLPKGTVYINLPALNRVARKLNIDCAPACVGFNFSGRGALPAFEGFVVCEEFEDTLRQAWEEEQVEAQKRAIEKREKRIYGNWKKLIKGLLIREKLAAKYNFRDEDEGVDNDEEIVTTTKGNKTLKRANQKSNSSKKKIKS